MLAITPINTSILLSCSLYEGFQPKPSWHGKHSWYVACIVSCLLQDKAFFCVIALQRDHEQARYLSLRDWQSPLACLRRFCQHQASTLVDLRSLIHSLALNSAEVTKSEQLTNPSHYRYPRPILPFQKLRTNAQSHCAQLALAQPRRHY